MFLFSLQAKWMNQDKEMPTEIIGGNVFEFVTELHNTVAKKLPTLDDNGIGSISPDNCDHAKVPCEFNKYAEYAYLKMIYNTEISSIVTFDAYNPERTAILECPQERHGRSPPMSKDTIRITLSKRSKTSNQVATSNIVALGEKKTPFYDASEAENGWIFSSSKLQYQCVEYGNCDALLLCRAVASA